LSAGFFKGLPDCVGMARGILYFSDLQFPKMSESAGIDRGDGVLVIV
jgi:hypothetical protein